MDQSGKIKRPPCPNCGTRTMLSGLMPRRTGFEVRAFRCLACERIITMQVEVADPIEAAEGWLSGELGRPST